MPVFGLTGNLGCGKSTALMLLKKKGASIFDVDEKIHEYYKNKKGPIYKKVSALFPQVIFSGAIDRCELGRIVFSDRKSLLKLETIVHPSAVRDLKSWVKNARKFNRVCVAEVPLLFEKNLEGIFDGVILVNVKKSVLLNRIKNNLKLSAGKANARLKCFKPAAMKMKKADFIINNSFGMETLKKEIDILWEKLKHN
ncbi:MAG: dephospho-CoA kinase [Candidatus Omnitrophica bacterium]|jgi:dephospho-CoA kinase|nr:dephospho-CoA kinase [Candidatus Omnitrophota bacterium]